MKDQPNEHRTKEASDKRSTGLRKHRTNEAYRGIFFGSLFPVGGSFDNRPSQNSIASSKDIRFCLSLGNLRNHEIMISCKFISKILVGSSGVMAAVLLSKSIAFRARVGWSGREALPRSRPPLRISQIFRRCFAVTGSIPLKVRWALRNASRRRVSHFKLSRWSRRTVARSKLQAFDAACIFVSSVCKIDLSAPSKKSIACSTSDR